MYSLVDTRPHICLYSCAHDCVGVHMCIYVQGYTTVVLHISAWTLGTAELSMRLHRCIGTDQVWCRCCCNVPRRLARTTACQNSRSPRAKHPPLIARGCFGERAAPCLCPPPIRCSPPATVFAAACHVSLGRPPHVRRMSAACHGARISRGALCTSLPLSAYVVLCSRLRTARSPPSRRGRACRTPAGRRRIARTRTHRATSGRHRASARPTRRTCPPIASTLALRADALHGRARRARSSRPALHA